MKNSFVDQMKLITIVLIIKTTIITNWTYVNHGITALKKEKQYFLEAIV